MMIYWFSSLLLWLDYTHRCCSPLIIAWRENGTNSCRQQRDKKKGKKGGWEDAVSLLPGCWIVDASSPKRNCLKNLFSCCSPLWHIYWGHPSTWPRRDSNMGLARKTAQGQVKGSHINTNIWRVQLHSDQLRAQMNFCGTSIPCSKEAQLNMHMQKSAYLKAKIGNGCGVG